jgi:hypothetical protein
MVAELKSNLIPPRINQLAGAKPMAIRDEDHGRVSMPPAIALRCRCEPFDLPIGQVLPSPIGSVRLPIR